ncbi:uncharacterized protein LOC125499740 isoform X2 [Athalia rosae]|uniref:uncharacterized protein LOC125499740 isoform X2 n=1 Tax=Athalia rosae TaxID=37344 RepID=UPI0020332914|nr:uncharacterized protein LOC125499740 isoform X2 [Athalia rosae]
MSLNLNWQKLSGTRCGSQQLRENLEIQLVGSHVQETLASDNQAALIRQLESATDVLEALIQHTQSLQVTQLSAQRVVQLAHQLILPYRPSSTSYSSSPSAELTTCLCQTVIDNHRMKKEDFKVAADNFKNLLENSKLTVSQMDKLQWQYESITDDYRQNRRILESELPKILKMRLKAIQQNFCTIATFYEDSEYSKIIGNLLKILGEKLHQKDPAASDHRNPYEKPQTQEICQKCQVNRVEKK